jgi:hypothetical protein
MYWYIVNICVANRLARARFPRAKRARPRHAGSARSGWGGCARSPACCSASPLLWHTSTLLAAHVCRRLHIVVCVPMYKLHLSLLLNYCTAMYVELTILPLHTRVRTSEASNRVMGPRAHDGCCCDDQQQGRPLAGAPVYAHTVYVAA